MKILNHQLLLFSTISLIFISGCNNLSKKNDTPKISTNIIKVDDNRFTFSLHGKYEDGTNIELFDKIYNINPNILYLGFISLDSLDKSPFSVQVFSDTSKIDIDSAFNITVNSKAKLAGQNIYDQYKLLDYGKYNKDGQTFRFKVSLFADTTVNTMFYFMKDDYDNSLYEIKISTSKSNKKAAKDYLEKVAKTVVIY